MAPTIGLSVISTRTSHRSGANEGGVAGQRLRRAVGDRRPGHAPRQVGADIEDYVILGACNPELAEQALDIDRQVELLLPCNVVVRTVGTGTVVEALDPAALFRTTGLDARCGGRRGPPQVGCGAGGRTHGGVAMDRLSPLDAGTDTGALLLDAICGLATKPVRAAAPADQGTAYARDGHPAGRRDGHRPEPHGHHRGERPVPHALRAMVPGFGAGGRQAGQPDLGDAAAAARGARRSGDRAPRGAPQARGPQARQGDRGRPGGRLSRRARAVRARVAGHQGGRPRAPAEHRHGDDQRPRARRGRCAYSTGRSSSCSPTCPSGCGCVQAWPR